MTTEPSINPFLHGDSPIRSLNRARIVALRGVPAGADVLGMTGYDLLSAAALLRQIVAAADRLRLDLGTPDVIRRFDGCFDDPLALPHARAIAHSYGHRLGCLLLMLKRGEPANRAARPEWSDAHWDFWRGMRRMYLGGGLMEGRLGQYAVETAQALLSDTGVADLALERATYARHLPLLGLARAAPPDMTGSILFDFGQTSVKRGCAHYHTGRLSRLDIWPDSPTVCMEPGTSPERDEEIRHRWRRMLDIIAASWASVPSQQRPCTALGISLACYLFDGHPSLRDHGCYGSLQRLCPHLAMFIADELVRRLGQAVEVALLHDGAAAAAVYAGSDRTVVITLGTALGNGFPPAAGDLRPIADDFALHQSAGP
jgi:hypothetical protein